MAGMMRHLIAIHRASASRNSFGVIPPSFTLLASVNADIDTLGGTEGQQADKTEARSQVRFTIAYYSGLTTEDQFVWDSRTFRIVAINDVDGMNVKHIVDTVEVG